MFECTMLLGCAMMLYFQFETKSEVLLLKCVVIWKVIRRVLNKKSTNEGNPEQMDGKEVRMFITF